MDHLTASVASSPAGRTAPTPGRPPQLDDRNWLLERLARYGERAIADELGCARGTVRNALARLDIPPQLPGRRRGVTLRRRITDATHSATAAEIVAHLSQNARARHAPTWTTVLTYLAAADEARKTHNRTDERAAAINLSIAAAKLADHLDRVA